MKMKTVKRITACFLLTAMTMLTACGSLTTISVEPNDEEITDDQSSLITIGFSQIGSESDWRMASTKSVQEAFTVENGYNLIYNDGQQKQENQLKAIREFIDQDVDYILLDPCVENGWDSALMEAKEAGIPVIVYDRMVEVENEDLYVAWIGSDFFLEGQKACAWLDKYLDSIGYEEDINIVDLQGTLGASAQIGRTEALNEAVRRHDKWHLISQKSGDFTTAKGKEVMESMLRYNGSNIDVVYCENDNMAYGAIEAIKKAGYKVGKDIANGEMLVISFDSTHEGLRLTMDGSIAVNTECSPLYGEKLVELIEALERGEELQKNTYIEEEQFSTYKGISSVRVGSHVYYVNMLSEELIESREY